MSLAQASMYFWKSSFASFGTPSFAAQAAKDRSRTRQSRIKIALETGFMGVTSFLFA